MTSNDPNDRLLTIGQAAQRCGVSVDTLRAWERNGRLAATRTAGGQRRFRAGDIASLRGTGTSAPMAEHEPNRSRSSRARSPVAASSARSRRTQDWVEEDPMVIEARTELEVTRAEAERVTLDQRLLDEARRRQREYEVERRRQAEAARLEELKAEGRALGADLPVEWFSKVTSDLEGFVTATNVPAALPIEEARRLVAARVARVREQFRAEQSVQLRSTLDSMKSRDLINLGLQLATRLTSFWDPQDAAAARLSVKRELANQVEANWSEADVRTLVEDVLSDWEEPEEDDEVDDDDEDDEDGWL